MVKEDIIDILKTIYDPEIPILDIYNMGLIYDIKVEDHNVYILMTFTSPLCPMQDMLLNMIQNAIYERFSESNVDIKITFEPVWSLNMIKDEDIKQIFVWEI